MLATDIELSRMNETFPVRTTRTPTDRARVVRWAALVCVAACGILPSRALSGDPGFRVTRGGAMWAGRHVTPEVTAGEQALAAPAAEPLVPFVTDGTLVQTHTGEHLPLSAAEPSAARFDRLLADHVTGSAHTIDPRLLELVRALVARYPGARVEIVSGYRSEKLNEARRKKGRHVASHSQHTLGHALDFRVVPAGVTRGVDPRALEKEIRALGWDGGVGTYPTASDLFVHADVGRNRRWRN